MKIEPYHHLSPIKNKPTKCLDCSIRRLALFHGVPENKLDWTQTYRHCQFTIPPRKDIFCELEPNKYMYTLYHGWVATYKTLADGRRQILRVVLPGDMLGFQPDFKANMTHSATSLTECVLCAFPRAEMPELLRSNSKVSKRLSELTARDMSICQTRLLAIGQQTAIEKLAFFCSELYYRINHIYNQADGNKIQLPLSQEDIGDATGLTKIHVNRTLKALREKGLMSISSKVLTIHDVDGLAALGGFDPTTVLIHSFY